MDANLAGAFVAAIALGLGIGLTWAEHVTREQRKIDGDGLLDVADAMGVTK